MRGKEPAPEPRDGDVYDLVGIETGYFQTISEEAWEEIGSVAMPTPWYSWGFVTRFEFIALRKL
jgi:hypothetical protein